MTKTELSDLYSGKRVFVTGHTGFKGSWLCAVLERLGADVVGFSLLPPTVPSLFELACIEKNITSVIGDIRSLDTLKAAFDKYRPEIVFHLAAQPIVRESYQNPVLTYETNVMGTVNLLECVRLSDSVRSVVNITTDKVYKNNEWAWGYRENDELCGFDPYSNSKSCSELVTYSYKNSFFAGSGVAVSTARAGNVLGGGDFAADRIIPDCVRAAEKHKDIIVRNPHSTRPYQHVLESVFAYLLIAKKQLEDISYADCYNVGPDDNGMVKTGQLVDMFVAKWGDGLKWRDISDNRYHEANFLKLDTSKIRARLGWRPTWDIEKTLDKIIEWSRLYIGGAAGDELRGCMDRQINEFFDDMRF